MAQDSLSGPLVIRFYADIAGAPSHCRQQPVVHFVLNQALIRRHNRMAARGETAGNDLAIATADRKLGLVAIPPGIRHPQHRLDRNIGQLADPLQRVLYRLPLDSQLPFIRQMLQLAAAAGFIDRARRRHPLRIGHIDLQ